MIRILLAMVAGILLMPLDIYTFNHREVGTQKLSPWQRVASAIAHPIAFLTRLLRALRAPAVWRVGLGLAVVLLAATHHLHGAGVSIAPMLADPKELREQINKLGTDMLGIVNKAKEDKRDMTAEEEASFDKMDKDREDLQVKERRALAIKDIEDPAGRRVAPAQPGQRSADLGGNGEAERLADDHNDGVRAWFAAQLGLPLTREQEDLCKRLGVDVRSKSLNIRRPKRGLRSAAFESEQRWEKDALTMLRAKQKNAEQRAMSTLTVTSPEDGSYLIANEAMLPLERALLAYGGVRGVSNVLRTRTGAALPIPTSNDTPNKGALLAENIQAVEKDTEFGSITLNAFKFTSKKVLISRELFQDSNEDLGTFMFAALGERLGRILNQYATTGSGSGEPNGVVTAATSSGTTLGAKTPTYLELVATEGALDPAYRPGASWMFSDTMLQEIKKIVDTTNRPIWLPDMRGGAPDTILGYNYTINQDMAAAASTGSGKALLFGAMKKYLYREVQDIEVLRLNELYAEYYQVAFVGFARMDADLIDAGTHPVVYTANHS